MRNPSRPAYATRVSPDKKEGQMDPQRGKLDSLFFRAILLPGSPLSDVFRR